MIDQQAAEVIAKKYFGDVEVVFQDDGEFRWVHVPGRTSIMLLIGPDGGALSYHVAKSTLEDAKRDYLAGQRSSLEAEK